MRRLLTVVLLLCATTVTASAAESWIGLNLRAQAIYVEMNKLNSPSWGVGVEGSWFPMTRFLAQGRYSKSNFSNGNSFDYKTYHGNEASPKLKPFTYYEAGAQLNLIVTSGTYSHDETKQVAAGTRTEVDANGVTRTYTVYKTVKTGRKWYTNEYRMFGIRGGIYKVESSMPGDVTGPDDTIRYENGNIIAPPDLTFTNHTMTGYYVGLGRTRVFYREGLWNTFFVDVLFSSKLTYEDPVLTGFTERKIGGRIGIEGTRRHIGGRLEIGVRPGVDKLYLLTHLTFGFML